eukprot:TRINITY_DN13111_c0_g1_i1.p1 TRINITY_DN13111_c0_g1~~TRINITY_DN13111_c0_g1_i1.p1  ORF type:complete len:155 (-),score=37.04 TRINITY_DN13111_c0_g1_i1:375-839(-)
MMLTRFANVVRQLTKRPLVERVGIDASGNQFFREAAATADEKERRWVDFKVDAESKNLPVEWTSWLAGTRTLPPTAEEIERAARQRILVKQRAAVLEAEEEKRKFRKTSLGVQMPGPSSAYRPADAPFESKPSAKDTLKPPPSPSDSEAYWRPP